MKILCLTGMPQTGKTTLINELIKIEGVEAIKIGEEYRKRFTPEERYWEATGDLAPEEVTEEMVKLAVEEADQNGTDMIIIDGMPRNASQALFICNTFKQHKLYFVMLTVNADTLVKRSEERGRIDDTKDILFTRMCKFSEELLDIICNVTLHGYRMEKIDTGYMSVKDEVKFIKEIVGMER